MRPLIVIPTYQEAENIAIVLQRVRAAAPNASVLVVDDGSPDGTADLAESTGAEVGQVSVLRRTHKAGLGSAYRAGFKRGIELGHDVLLEMDADLSHDPKYLPELVSRLDRDDLVIGSRYLRGISVVNWPLHRIALSAFANRYIRAVTGVSATDCTSAYRVWRREALARVPLVHARASGYAFLTEMLYEATRQRCRIGEVPIVFWGPGILGGDAGREARTIDIAPTLAKLLGVAAPADLDGEPLPLE